MASSYDDVRVLVETTLEDNWTDTPVEYDNAPAGKHDDKAWIRVYISDGLGSPSLIAGPRTIGPRVRTTHTGFISFDVFVPINTGTALSNQLKDKLNSLFYFNYDNSGNIKIMAPEARRGGELDTHHQTIIEFEFRRDFIPD